MLYLCFGPCTEVHQNGYWKRYAAKNDINILNEGLVKIRIEERTRNRQIIHVPRFTFTFYLQTTIQPLYFMRYAQFYALAIFFMYRL